MEYLDRKYDLFNLHKTNKEFTGTERKKQWYNEGNLILNLLEKSCLNITDQNWMNYCGSNLHAPKQTWMSSEILELMEQRR